MRPLFAGFAALCIFYTKAVFPQAVTTPEKDSTIIPKTKATIFTGLVYVPRLHYYGRSDSLKSGALIPTLLIQFDSSGFYLSGSTVFINNNTQPFTYGAAITEAGYKFGKRQNGVGGSIYADKFFYKTKYLVQSSLKWQAGLNLAYYNKIMNISGAGLAAFSGMTDIFSTITLDHSFKTKKGRSVFLFTPTAAANAGTQHFTYNYYKRNNLLFVPVANQQATKSSSRFNILSYEFSMPVIWARKNLFVIATPGYVIPQNIIKVESRPDLSERAENLFYTNLTLLYSFKIKHH